MPNPTFLYLRSYNDRGALIYVCGPLQIIQVTAAIVATNKNGDVCPSNASKIQKFSILTQDFSVSTGELTPTLKLKRAHTQKAHSELVKKIYASKELYVSSV